MFFGLRVYFGMAGKYGHQSKLFLFALVLGVAPMQDRICSHQSTFSFVVAANLCAIPSSSLPSTIHKDSLVLLHAHTQAHAQHPYFMQV